LIAVGFGKPVKDNARTVNGKWIVLSVADDGSTKILAERRDVKKYITTMKWHSYGDRLAVGSGDHKICVYSILTDTEPATALDITLLSMIDLTSTPIHFDFSRDGKYLKVNTESYDLNFFEAGPGIHIKEPSKLKDMQWETETCIFGWHVQGVWDEEEVSSLDSSVEQESPMIAYGTLNGNIKLSKFPCLTKNAQCLTYPAHLGPVHNVSWLPGYLISTGEKDNAIMIWRQQASCESTGHPDDHTSAYSGGISATLSSDETECHAALYNMSGQQIIYPSSGTCIILNPGDQQMMVSFQKHDTTVAAICTSNSRQLVASADSNSVRIWQSQTRNEVATLTFERQQCVALLSFSSDDMKLVCLCSGGLFVWMTMNGDWNKAHLAFHTLAGREKVHFALYDTSQTIIVSGGRGHVNFWTEQHSTLALSKAVLPKNLEDGTFFCGIAVNDKIVTGTSRGSIVIWQGSKVVQDIQAHGVGVTSLCACPEGFLSGSAAGIVILWTSSLQKVSSFDAAELPPSPIRSLDMFPSLKRTSTMKVLVRSEAGDIYEISCVTGNVSLLCNLRSNDIPTAVENPTVPVDVTM